MEKFNEYHILPERGKFTVKGYGTYARHSVLAGQVRIVFIDSFDTFEEAKAAFPEAVGSHAMLEPVNTFDHLSDEEGAY